MPWQDRIQFAQITTPDGKAYQFDYRDLSSEGQNKTSVSQFQNETLPLVQNFGQGIYKVPMTIYFSGDDYDETASKFDVSIALPGNCTLEHPLYGVRTVVIESWRRSDALVTGANQAVYTLTITETLAPEQEVVVAQAVSEIQFEIDEAAVEIGEIAAAAGYDVRKPSILARAAARIRAALNNFKQAMSKILDKAAQVRAAVEAGIAFVEGSISTLLAVPAVLFGTIASLVKLPSQIATRISEKISGYGDLLDSFLGTVVSGTDTDSKNQRIEAQAFTAAYTNAIADSNLYAAEQSAATAQIGGTVDDAVIEAIESGEGYITRSEATAAASALIDTLRDVQEKNDEEQRAAESATLDNRFAASDTQNQTLSRIVYGTAGTLISLAYQLRQEREVELSNEITPIEACFNFYNSTKPNTLDFFIWGNKLEGDEFFILPRGRVVKYYV